MTTEQNQILTALRDLDAAVKALPTADLKPDIGGLLRRIDDLTQRLPKDSDPDLVHYLRRKSYEKARLWLEGRDAENARGRCG